MKDRTIALAVCGITILVVLVCLCAAVPPVGWSTVGTIVDVYDGDTLTFEVKKRFKVRLIDCWAPEVRTRDLAEQQRGFASKEHLKSIALDKPGVLFVPAGRTHVGQATSLSRVLGHVWVDGESLASQQVEAGHADP